MSKFPDVTKSFGPNPSILGELELVGRRNRRVGFVVAALVLLGTLIWIAGYFILENGLPDPVILKHRYPVIQYGSDQTPEVRFQRERPESWVTVDQVSQAAIGAVIVSEDWAFYQHSGYDWRQIREVILESIKEGKLSRGASTITQQVARNLFLSQEKTVSRKIRELILAMRIEEVFPKQKILEFYLNIAEWGEGAVGIERASQTYFQKPASELTAKEGAFLAMLLPSPNRYAESFRQRSLTPFARKRIDAILADMKQAGYLTEEELALHLEEPLAFEAEVVEPLTENAVTEDPVTEVPVTDVPEEEEISDSPEPIPTPIASP